MDPIYGDVQPPKKEAKVEVQVNDINFLLECIQRLPTEEQERFTKTYGRLIDLLKVHIEPEALRAMEVMIQYWSPELRVFEFPNLDASPTVEEYEMLLDIPVLDRSKVYLFTGDHELKEEYIEEMIGTRPGVQNIIRQGKFEGLKWTYLKKHIIKMEEQKNWKSFGSSFALAIYGLVLFPFVADMIDREALDVFYKVKRFSINPVPAVLAETLLQFHKGHQVAKERTKIRYCVQLLYVWMITRFRHHQFPLGSRYPLRRFNNTNIKPVTLSEWSRLFKEINPRNFGVKCCLYDRHEEVMFSCGEYQNLVLMGPRGCITFTPALVLGQLKWGMNSVAPQQIQGFVLLYKDKNASKELLDTAKKAIQDIHFYGKKELGEHQTFYTKEYNLWRKERMTSKTSINIIMPKEKEGPTQTEINLLRRIKILEGQLEESRNTLEKESFSREKLNEVNLGLKEEVTSLKTDYANLCSSLKREEREVRGLKSQLKARERIIFNLRKEKEESDRSLDETRAESEQDRASATKAWAVVDECQKAVEQGLRREDQYRAMIDDQTKIHRLNINKISEERNQLLNQLGNLEHAYDQMAGERERWSNNWTQVLDGCEADKLRWEKRCLGIIDGIGEFADDWLVTFEAANQEASMYPETGMLPDMRTFFTKCTQVARKLKKWRKSTEEL
ncbi:hypothetical protein Lal_00031800 [Lupinus albus]|nr:hypothetical protein Lal_00031800 [Lupinus albus]